MTKKILKGVITSAKNNKTVVVEVTRKFKHPFYEKVIKRTKKYHAHDETNKFKEGGFDFIKHSLDAQCTLQEAWCIYFYLRNYQMLKSLISAHFMQLLLHWMQTKCK